VTQAAGKKH